MQASTRVYHRSSVGPSLKSLLIAIIAICELMDLAFEGAIQLFCPLPRRDSHHDLRIV